MNKSKEFGDFQTPKELAQLIIEILRKKDFTPDVIIEPTCGKGSILVEAEKSFSNAEILGIEIQREYVDFLFPHIGQNTNIVNADFFNSIDFIKSFVDKNENLLFVGNPPWVTNSELSTIDGSNFPKKYNIDDLRGIEAITGKSNFDICESIIMQLISEFSDKQSIFSFLCKTAVARKIMQRLWKNNFKYKDAELYPVDSKKYFSAAVDSCFFILDCTEKKSVTTLKIFNSIEEQKFTNESGFVNGIYITDVSKMDSLEVCGKSIFTWHNGIKHDSAKILELKNDNGILKNGKGETVDVENELLFPLLKSSDIANNDFEMERKILVTQKYIGESTDYIKSKFPKIWSYLENNESYFCKRKSVIYKNKPRFAIFSVGDYTFKPYKIAISGLYKNLNFVLIGPKNGKPVMLDDTCNYISFDDIESAKFVFTLLKSDVVKEYLSARISFDSKRPVTTEILNSIDLEKVAQLKNKTDDFFSLFKICISPSLFTDSELKVV